MSRAPHGGTEQRGGLTGAFVWPVATEATVPGTAVAEVGEPL